MIRQFVLVTIIALGSVQASYGQLFNSERLANLETFDSRPTSCGYFLGFNNYYFNFDYNR